MHFRHFFQLLNTLGL